MIVKMTRLPFIVKSVLYGMRCRGRVLVVDGLSSGLVDGGCLANRVLTLFDGRKEQNFFSVLKGSSDVGY